ncbi:MAG: sugar ABC transporter permease, partial [Oscillospiraceae bacterium]|nr:sugar ABC transporter permease [Oscillospiraceae bacterium]
MNAWNAFKEAAGKSSWKVKLSALIMGGGQMLYGCWQKGLIYLLVEVSVLWYFLTRGISDIVGFFTLGTQKADPWTGTVGDNSVVMLLMGIFAWIVIIVFLCIYVSNLKDAYAIERRVKSGGKPLSFKAEVAQLLDRKFYITALALPVLGVG